MFYLNVNGFFKNFVWQHCSKLWTGNKPKIDESCFFFFYLVDVYWDDLDRFTCFSHRIRFLIWNRSFSSSIRFVNRDSLNAIFINKFIDLNAYFYRNLCHFVWMYVCVCVLLQVTHLEIENFWDEKPAQKLPVDLFYVSAMRSMRFYWVNLLVIDKHRFSAYSVFRQQMN